MQEVNFDFNLQYFAEGGGEGADGNVADTGDGNKPDANKNTGDKEEDKNKDLKTPEEVDKAVKAAIAEAKAAWEKEYKQKAEQERKEAERLSKLSEEQKRAEELESLKRELAAKEGELKQRELREEMTNVLEKRGIPLAFMDYFIASDSESTLKRITDFEKAYKKAIADGVDAKLKSTVPPGGGGSAGNNGGNNSNANNGFLEIIRKNQAKR